MRKTANQAVGTASSQAAGGGGRAVAPRRRKMRSWGVRAMEMINAPVGSGL
ncbi:hypothetical protein [Streptomyces sp. NPDC002845]